MKYPRVVRRREEHLSFRCLYFFILLIGLLYVLADKPVQAQTKVLIKDAFFEIDARKAIDLLYNRKTEEAQAQLAPWKQKYPEHPIWGLWDGMELWWKILEDLDNLSRDREFIAKMQRADYEAGQVLRADPGHPDALVIRAVANGYIARLHANRKNWLTSVQVGRRAYQAHQKLMEIVPGLPDNYFAEGIKMYYADYIPEAYPVVKAVSWFFPEGDVSEGLENLEYAAEKGVFARPEANYFLATILLNYEQEYDKAKQRFRQLVDKYPNNSFYRRQYLQTLSQLRQYDEILVFATQTLKYWQNSGVQEDPVLSSEVNYWIGRAHFYNGDLSSALPFLRTSVKTGSELVNCNERKTYALAAYFTGRTLEMLNQNDEAKKYYHIAADQKTVPEARERSRDHLKNL